MKNYAEHHRARLERDLAPDERLVAAARVMVSAAAPNGFEPDTGEGEPPAEDPNQQFIWRRGERMRKNAARGRGTRQVRLAVARDCGFELPGLIFVVGVTNKRVLIWSTSKWFAQPVEVTADIPASEVAAVRVEHRMGATRLGILLHKGPLLVLQPLWSRGLPAVAEGFDDL
jgi:hypothetical protein